VNDGGPDEKGYHLAHSRRNIFADPGVER